MMYRKTFPDEPEKPHRDTPYAGPSCKFNEGVSCSNRDHMGRRIQPNCESCGWNPVVACQRKHDIMVKLGIIKPDHKI